MSKKLDPVNVAFGKALTKVRRKSGMSQGDLASRVNLSRTSITNIEAGRQAVSMPLLFSMASALGLMPSDLLPDNDLLDLKVASTDEFSEYELPPDTRQWADRVLQRS